MREIRFRAWDVDNKQIMYIYQSGWAFPLKEFTLDELLENDVYVFQQYIGFKDKNGKEIYEGDILMFPDTESEYVNVGVGEVKVAQTEI